MFDEFIYSFIHHPSIHRPSSHPSSRPSSHLVIHSSIICSSLHPSIHPPDVHLLAHPFIHPPIRRERLGPRQQERRLRHDLLSAVSAACGAQPRAGQGLGMSSPTLHTQTRVRAPRRTIRLWQMTEGVRREDGSWHHRLRACGQQRSVRKARGGGVAEAPVGALPPQPRLEDRAREGAANPGYGFAKSGAK